MNKISPAWIVVALLLGYILFLQMCSKKGTSAGTSVKVDTNWIISNFVSTWEKPKPDTIIKPKIEYRYEYRDTGSILHEPIPYLVYGDTLRIKAPITRQDTIAIIEQFLVEVHYTDSLKIPYGVVRWKGVIARNALQRRQWSFIDSIAVVTKTITRQPITVYAGFGGYTPVKQDPASPLNFISAAEIDLGFTNRRGQSFEGSILFTNQPVQAGIKFKQPIFKIK